MPDGILCRHKNLNLLSFRVGSRSPATFKTELSVTTVNNSFQLYPIFCHKEFRLRCFVWLKLSIVTWSTKIWGVLWYQGAPPMIECNLGNIWKTHFLRCSKNTFPEVFHINYLSTNPTKWSNTLKRFIGVDAWRVEFFAFNNKWTKWYKMRS